LGPGGPLAVARSTPGYRLPPLRGGWLVDLAHQPRRKCGKPVSHYMSSVTRFRYRIVMEPGTNPPSTYERVREELRSWILEHGLGYGMSALGGSRVLSGDIGFNPPATEADRQALAAWLHTRHMCATVALGPMEDDAISWGDPITDVVFVVDTLTCAERVAAAERYAEMRRQVEAMAKKVD
jgi:hypothetical protein